MNPLNYSLMNLPVIPPMHFNMNNLHYGFYMPPGALMEAVADPLQQVQQVPLRRSARLLARQQARQEPQDPQQMLPQPHALQEPVMAQMQPPQYPIFPFFQVFPGVLGPQLGLNFYPTNVLRFAVGPLLNVSLPNAHRQQQQPNPQQQQQQQPRPQQQQQQQQPQPRPSPPEQQRQLVIVHARPARKRKHNRILRPITRAYRRMLESEGRAIESESSDSETDEEQQESDGDNNEDRDQQPPDNVERVPLADDVDQNAGQIDQNAGPVDQNAGQIDQNAGPVDQNAGVAPDQQQLMEMQVAGLGYMYLGDNLYINHFEAMLPQAHQNVANAVPNLPQHQQPQLGGRLANVVRDLIARPNSIEFDPWDVFENAFQSLNMPRCFLDAGYDLEEFHGFHLEPILIESTIPIVRENFIDDESFENAVQMYNTRQNGDVYFQVNRSSIGFVQIGNSVTGLNPLLLEINMDEYPGMANGRGFRLLPAKRPYMLPTFEYFSYLTYSSNFWPTLNVSSGRQFRVGYIIRQPIDYNEPNPQIVPVRHNINAALFTCSFCASTITNEHQGRVSVARCGHIYCDSCVRMIINNNEPICVVHNCNQSVQPRDSFIPIRF